MDSNASSMLVMLDFFADIARTAPDMEFESEVRPHLAHSKGLTTFTLLHMLLEHIFLTSLLWYHL